MENRVSKKDVLAKLEEMFFDWLINDKKIDTDGKYKTLTEEDLLKLKREFLAEMEKSGKVSIV